jgi:glucan biosynthesis protein
MENWKKIKDFETYSISDKGRVRNDTTQKILVNPVDIWGYNRIGLVKVAKQQKFRKVHRLVAEAFLTNEENKKCIDHIDRNRQNNCVENLRYVTSSENQKNLGLMKTNKSGVTGVLFEKSRKKWRVTVKVNSKSILIGRFNDFDVAVKARKQAQHKYYGEYQRFDNELDKIDYFIYEAEEFIKKHQRFTNKVKFYS